jgi:hypothetical protein
MYLSSEKGRRGNKNCCPLLSYVPLSKLTNMLGYNYPHY